MNSLTESPSCLQKLPVHQPMLPKARSPAEADLLLALLVARFLADPGSLFQASPAALSLHTWLAPAALEDFRRAAILHLGHRLLAAKAQPGSIEDERASAFDWVVEAATKPAPPPDAPAVDPKLFAYFLAQLGLDPSELADEELEKLKTEFYYLN